MDGNKLINYIPSNIDVSKMTSDEKLKYGNRMLINKLTSDLKKERHRRRKLAKRLLVLETQLNVIKFVIDNNKKIECSSSDESIN